MSTIYNVKVGGDCEHCNKPFVKPESWTWTALKATAIFSAFSVAVYAAYWYGAENAAKTCGWAFEEAVHEDTSTAVVFEYSSSLGERVSKFVLESTPGINLDFGGMFESVKNIASSGAEAVKNQAVRATAQLTAETWKALPVAAKVTATGTGAAGGAYATSKLYSFGKGVVYSFTRFFGGYRTFRPHG